MELAGSLSIQAFVSQARPSDATWEAIVRIVLNLIELLVLRVTGHEGGLELNFVCVDELITLVSHRMAPDALLVIRYVMIVPLLHTIVRGPDKLPVGPLKRLSAASTSRKLQFSLDLCGLPIVRKRRMVE